MRRRRLGPAVIADAVGGARGALLRVASRGVVVRLRRARFRCRLRHGALLLAVPASRSRRAPSVPAAPRHPLASIRRKSRSSAEMPLLASTEDGAGWLTEAYGIAGRMTVHPVGARLRQLMPTTASRPGHTNFQRAEAYGRGCLAAALDRVERRGREPVAAAQVEPVAGGQRVEHDPRDHQRLVAADLPGVGLRRGAVDDRDASRGRSPPSRRRGRRRRPCPRPRRARAATGSGRSATAAARAGSAAGSAGRR